jgi:hypothetical protein
MSIFLIQGASPQRSLNGLPRLYYIAVIRARRRMSGLVITDIRSIADIA